MADASPKSLNRYCRDFDKAYDEYNIFQEYLEFSKFWQTCFVTSPYIIYTGNFQTVNQELMYRFMNKVAKHPIMWKFFRMIFGV